MPQLLICAGAERRLKAPRPREGERQAPSHRWSARQTTALCAANNTNATPQKGTRCCSLACDARHRNVTQREATTCCAIGKHRWPPQDGRLGSDSRQFAGQLLHCRPTSLRPLLLLLMLPLVQALSVNRLVRYGHRWPPPPQLPPTTTTTTTMAATQLLVGSPSPDSLASRSPASVIDLLATGERGGMCGGELGCLTMVLARVCVSLSSSPAMQPSDSCQRVEKFCIVTTPSEQLNTTHKQKPPIVVVVLTSW